MRGRNVSTSSSWNDDSSHTTQASGAAEPTRAVRGRPMLPATSTGRPAASKTAPSNAVVVVLPLVPVTPRMGFGSSLAPSSISEITGRPRARAASTSGARPSIPGLFTTRSIPSRSAASPGPRRTSAPSDVSGSTSSSVELSCPTTSSPRESSARAAASPERASPSTSTLTAGSGGSSGSTARTRSRRGSLPRSRSAR